ncbi:hypothetical protein DQ384_20525 [Sphaerisporangium album]|uniref:Uncharacterized protein n=1 Tax=Sphaerisporangium album TaxID=509200 RepID=A0A367FGK4_9ACTN|nr:DUF6461 domain-containing protein [Sphaerisporangium album]RCG29434.1 hypothetical protein DQ384_20525 [Sphaerisporangium album]
MKPAERLYDLLSSYDDSDVSMWRFYAVWCEGIAVEEAVLLLSADPDTATPATFVGWGPGSDGSGDEDSGLLVGTISAWVVLIGDHRCTEDEALSALSENNRRTLGISWDSHDDNTLKYARDGELITVLDIFDTSDRSGRDPDALDPYLHGLRFNIDERKPGEPMVEPHESFHLRAGRHRQDGRPGDRQGMAGLDAHLLHRASGQLRVVRACPRQAASASPATSDPLSTADHAGLYYGAPAISFPLHVAQADGIPLLTRCARR